MFIISALLSVTYSDLSTFFTECWLSQKRTLSSYNINWGFGVIFLFFVLRSGIVKFSRTHIHSISPPCEIIIEQAERTNRYHGHENSRFLSRRAEFSPLQTIKALPPSHTAWDQLAAALSHLVKTQTVRETVAKMPLLDASAKALPELYLQRAATILGMTAHVFVRLEGSELLTLKYDRHSDILPPSLVIPWAIVCKRLGRSTPVLTLIDMMVANFTSTSLSYSDVMLENLELLVPTVGNIEEHTFFGIMIEINAKAIPILHQIIEAQRSVLARNSSSLKDAIRNLHTLLKQITRTLEKIHANRSRKGYIDPHIWTATVANLGIPWLKDVVGAAGTAHPFFHMMDEFTGRSDYHTGIGKEAIAVRAIYPIHWRQFLEAIREVSVTEYIVTSKDRELMEIWNAFTSLYHSKDGLLGVHRRKVLDFLAVSFRIGRDTTINGLGRRRINKPWLEADQELEKARLERRCFDPDEHLTSTEPGSKKFFISELIKNIRKRLGIGFRLRVVFTMRARLCRGTQVVTP
ncbi:hypothetical protein EAE96_001837 [Botrytis aclada]|nr:hypothetical protein EAE96_001837 [Botrytis aclada]